MTVPNIITIGRFLLVPVMVWALLVERPALAFGLFLVAGLSDALDGLLARLLRQRSALGAVLDPLADKLMLVSAYAALAWLGDIPVWLAALVIGRDLLLLAGSALAIACRVRLDLSPLPVSKVNTLLQIVFVVAVMGTEAAGWHWPNTLATFQLLVAFFTIASAWAYALRTARSIMADKSDTLATGRKV